MARFVILLAAIFSACPAIAGTYYTFAPVQAGTFALDPSGISETSAGRTANIYYIHPTRVVEEYATEFDCAGGKVLVHSRRMMRYDLTPLRSIKISTTWEKPDTRTSIGIALRLICDWPKAPASAPTEAAGLVQFLGETSDRLRENAKDRPSPSIARPSATASSARCPGKHR